MKINNFKNRLYGRTRGRSNKNISIEKYLKLIDEYKLNKISLYNEYILDIGTGYGETSLYLAKKYPDKIILSCEKYVDGNLNLLKKIKNEKIKNIRIFAGNVFELLEDNKFSRFNLIWIFFPDPWPKKKHHKRRLINDIFLEKIYHYLNINSKIFIITDSTTYSKSILCSIFNKKHLYEWINQYTLFLSLKDYHNLETKFYKKAIILGKKPSIFILKKI